MVVKIKVLGMFLLITWLAACSLSTGVKRTAPPSSAGLIYTHQRQNIHLTHSLREQETRQFLVLINRYRRQHELGTLAIDPKLQKAAQWLSDDMAEHDVISHTDSLGRGSFQRLDAFGYTYNTFKAENVASGQGSAEEVLQAWQNSPGHNANMLNPHFRFIGIGLAYNRNTEFGWFWATTFGGTKNRPN